MTEQVEPGHAALVHRLVEVAAELLLQQAVGPPRLLLGAQLQAVVGRLAAPGLTVLAGRYGATLDRALRRVAALALEIELGALAPAEPADRTVIVRQFF